MFENFLNNFYLENSKKIKIYTLKTIHIIHIPTNKTTKHWFKKQCSAFSVLFLNQRQFMQKSWDSVQTIHLGWWLLPRKSFLWFFYIIPLVFLKSRASLEQAGFCHLKRHISIHIAWWLVMKSFPMFLHNFLIFFFGMLICYFIQFSEHGLKRDHLRTPRMMSRGSPPLHCFSYNPPSASLTSKEFSRTLVLPKSKGFSGTLLCYFI
jgi:hypothetical protein